jgi:hypothetical protein
MLRHYLNLRSMTARCQDIRSDLRYTVYSIYYTHIFVLHVSNVITVYIVIADNQSGVLFQEYVNF